MGKKKKPNRLGAWSWLNSQAVAEEFEAQRGSASCPKSHSKAGHWPSCLTSEHPRALTSASSQSKLVPPSPQANLPLLQRELLHCARLAKQSPAQYLAQHEQALLDADASSPVDSSELLLEVNDNGKRRTPDRYLGAQQAAPSPSDS